MKYSKTRSRQDCILGWWGCRVSEPAPGIFSPAPDPENIFNVFKILFELLSADIQSLFYFSLLSFVSL